MLNLKLDQLKVFVSVAENRSVSQAAIRVSRSPAAVSMTLTQIETQIGNKLFEGERKTNLTPMGKTLLNNARRVLEVHTRALTNIQLFADGHSGQLRIAVVPSVASRILPQVIADLSRQHPQIVIDIRDTDSHSVHQQIEDGHVDLGIASDADNELLQSDFFFADRFKLICSKEHPIAKHQDSIQLADLDAKEFIVSGLTEQIENSMVKELNNSSRLYIHNTQSILSFIESGYGYTLLPSLVLPRHGPLIACPITDLDLKRHLYIIKKKFEQSSPLTEQLITQLQLTLRSMRDF